MAIKTLLCTGFHRSATSATAHYLQQSGLGMGDELMEGSISNPNGHYEDWPVVRLHDQQLKNNKTNWQFHDEVPLVAEPEFLTHYIASRNQTHAQWGVKDPRACLFLDQWQQALGNNGYFLFVARHWSSCIESLLKRHSRTFAYQQPTLNQDSIALQFWLKPELGANMWLAYSKRLVNFAKKHPNQTIITTQRALFNGAPILNTLNERFGFSLDTTIETPFNSALLDDTASEMILEGLSFGLQAKLNTTWQQLLELADFSHAETANFYTPKAIPSLLIKQYQSILVDNAQSAQPNQSQQDILLGFINDSEHNSDNVITALQTLSANHVTTDTVSMIEKYIHGNHPTNGKLWIQLGRFAQKAGHYQTSIRAFRIGISLGCSFPYVSSHIGQCYQQLNQNHQARYFLDKAIKENPQSPQFYINKTQHLLLQLQRDTAQLCVEEGINQCGYVPSLVIKYVDMLLNQGDVEKSQRVLTNCTKPEHPSIINLNNRLKFQHDYDAGIADYHEQVRQTLKNKDSLVWLAQVGHLLSHAHAEKDFMTRCYQHWQTLGDIDIYHTHETE